MIIFHFIVSLNTNITSISYDVGMEDSVPGGVTELNTKQRHQMKHRELFLSRQVETMPATHIRGKCCVTLLNETESLLSYLNKEDSFFYCLVFDPAQRTLLADKGKSKYQNKYSINFFSINVILYILQIIQRLMKLYLLL